MQKLARQGCDAHDWYLPSRAIKGFPFVEVPIPKALIPFYPRGLDDHERRALWGMGGKLTTYVNWPRIQAMTEDEAGALFDDLRETFPRGSKPPPT